MIKRNKKETGRAIKEKKSKEVKASIKRGRGENNETGNKGVDYLSYSKLVKMTRRDLTKS